MTDKQEQCGPATEQAKRARWETPEIYKLEAGEAEGAAATGNDNTVYS